MTVELKSILLRWARISMLSSKSRSAHWKLFSGTVICPFFYTAKILKKAAPHGYTKMEYSQTCIILFESSLIELNSHLRSVVVGD